MTDGSNVTTPNVATTVLSIQQHSTDRSPRPQQQQQQGQGKWHQQGLVMNGGARRNVYRTNSRRRCDLTPAVKRCAVTEQTAAVTAAATTVTDDSDHQQQPTTLFSRRYVINLDPLSPRPTGTDQVRPGRGHVPPVTGVGKARLQRQQTTHHHQLTPRALRTARTDVSAGARLTTRREQTMIDENFLSATGKKLLDGSATPRNGETCRVIELKLNGANTATTALHGAETSRRYQQQQQQQRAAETAAAATLQHSDSSNHHGSAGTAAGCGGGVVLPQLSTHR